MLHFPCASRTKTTNNLPSKGSACTHLLHCRAFSGCVATLHCLMRLFAPAFDSPCGDVIPNRHTTRGRARAKPSQATSWARCSISARSIICGQHPWILRHLSRQDLENTSAPRRHLRAHYPFLVRGTIRPTFSQMTDRRGDAVLACPPPLDREYSRTLRYPADGGKTRHTGSVVLGRLGAMARPILVSIATKCEMVEYIEQVRGPHCEHRHPPGLAHQLKILTMQTATSCMNNV